MSFFSSFIRPPQSQPLPSSSHSSPSSPSSSISQQSNNNLYQINNENRTNDPLILWESLYNDGYCILPGAVAKTEIDNALREINRSMGRHVPNRQDMCPDCKTHPAIANLFNKSSLKGVLNTLLGDYGHVGGGQIALRFPGDHTGENYEIPKNWTYSWHIDGLGDYNDKQRSALFGDINNFTALVGVVLQDAEEEYMGNLTVYPGSHYQLQNYFRVYGFEDLYVKGVQGLPQLDFSATKPVQIRARAGDAIILNYSTAHNIAPNLSPFIRYTVYFRLTKQTSRPLPRDAHSSINSSLSSLPSPSTMKHRPESMLNVWSDWPGIQRMQFYHQDNPYQNVIAIERNLIPPSAPINQSNRGNNPQQLQIQQQPLTQPQSQPVQQQKSPQQPQQLSNRTQEDNENDEEMRQLAMVLERSKYDK